MAERKKETQVTQEMKEQAAEQLARVNAEKAAREAAEKQDGDGFGRIRTKGQSRAKAAVTRKSDIPAPELDMDGLGPTAFSAVLHGEQQFDPADQEFTIDEDKYKYLHFAKPGQNLPKKRLYTVKGFHKDGRLSQFPFEPQIQNTAGGDPEDAIGLQRYLRKGVKLLIDMTTLQPIYCAAWGCWAQADGETGFCSLRHAQHTLPNRYKDAGAITQSLISQNVTTSRTWAV